MGNGKELEPHAVALTVHCYLISCHCLATLALFIPFPYIKSQTSSYVPVVSASVTASHLAKAVAGLRVDIIASPQAGFSVCLKCTCAVRIVCNEFLRRF